MPADVTLNSGSGGAIIATDPTTSSEHYQLIKLAQGAVGTFTLVTSANAFPVVIGSSFQGGIISLSSQIAVTATAATNPWSSAPGFNVPIVSVSSGLVQLSSQITVTATGPVTITSGTVTLSSVHTVTATAATNPWSSAPGFNIPTVSVSSGLSQVSAVQVSPTSSVAGAGLLVITSSFGLVTQSTQPVTITSGTVTATAGTNPWSSAPGFNVPVVTVSSGLSQVFLPVTSVAGFGPVTSSAGQVVNLSSGTVTLSSVHTVTATAATNPWSSAPTFNVPVVTVSSGLVQISGTPLVNIVGTSSGVAVVTTSGGLVVQATGPFGTVTVLSVSSGLVQLTVPTLISLGTTAAAPVAVLVTSSGGPVFSAGVNTAAGYGPVTSSAGRLCSLSSGTVIMSSVQTVTATAGTNPWSSAPGFNVPVVNVSSGLVQALGVVAASSGVPSGLAFVNNITTGAAALSVNVKGTPGLWFGYTIYNSTAALRSIKIYNTTSAPTIGSTARIVSYLPVPGSTGGGGANAIFPYGVFCSNGIGYTITANAAATDTGAPGTNDVSLTLYYV